MRLRRSTSMEKTAVSPIADGAFFDFADMAMQRAAAFFDIGHNNTRAAICDDNAGVAGLAAGFGVERRLVGDDFNGVAVFRLVDTGAAFDDGGNDTPSASL